ncbi:hypothetical protein HY450_01175 [Candidatus Pacearchaeota archaeon]|nr:hypothetical protein [Candidatus Pacearchaeota archaeon]
MVHYIWRVLDMLEVFLALKPQDFSNLDGRQECNASILEMRGLSNTSTSKKSGAKNG